MSNFPIPNAIPTSMVLANKPQEIKALLQQYSVG